jgi:hypothetical protein
MICIQDNTLVVIDSLQSSGRLGALHDLITLPAIYRFISPGLKRDHSLFSAAGTDGRKHLAGASIVLEVAIIAEALGSSFLTAYRAAFRLIGIAFRSKEFLFLHCERKGFTTIDTSECFFLKCHVKNLLFYY